MQPTVESDGEPSTGQSDRKNEEVEQKLASGVLIKDIAKGSGKEKAGKGSKISFRFECQLDHCDEVVMNSGEDPFDVVLGAKNVLKGWNIGLNGVKVGTKRRVVCPPKTAYGAFGYPPKIPADATLVYNFEIISIEPPKMNK